MPISRSLGAILLSCLLLAPAAQAADLDALSLENLLSVEVTSASRFTQKEREAPASATVVTGEEIRQHGWRTLAEVLNAVPGIFLSTDRSYTYIGVRGYIGPSDYNANILLLIDGLPANDGVYNQAFLSTEFPVDMDYVERVEFVPGPGSSNYGGNAILGVVNVITATGRQREGNRLSVSAGNHETASATASHGYADDSRDLLLAASLYHSDGENVSIADTPDRVYGVARGMDGDHARRLLAKYASGGLDLLGIYSDRLKDYPTAIYDTVFNDSRAQTRDRMLLLAAGYRYEPLPALSLRSRLYLGASEFDGDYPIDYPPVTVNHDRASARWWGAEMQATDTRLDHHTLVYGLEYRNDYRLLQDNRDLDPVAVYFHDLRSEWRAGLYVQDEWRLTGWRLNAGLRLDRYSSFGNALSPRLALIQEWSADTTLKYIFGSAYRAPNAFERYYNDGNVTMKANPDIRPERIRTFEVAVEHAVGAGWLLGASLFDNRIDNLIGQTTDVSDGLLVYDNLGTASIRGVELSVRAVWPDGRRLLASVDCQRAIDADNGGTLPYIPRWVGKFDYTMPLGDWWATLEARYVGARRSWAGKVAGGAQVNLALVSAHPVLAGAQVSLRIENLFDRKLFDPASEEHTYGAIPRPGLAGTLDLTWQF